jgi:hypothetical protein
MPLAKKLNVLSHKGLMPLKEKVIEVEFFYCIRVVFIMEVKKSILQT